MWYWSNHFDYEIADGWYALTEVNWFNWIGAGTNLALAGVEGGDLFNFGSTGVAGNDIVTQAVKVKTASVNWGRLTNSHSPTVKMSSTVDSRSTGFFGIRKPRHHEL